MVRCRLIFWILAAAAILNACSDPPMQEAKGPIVLGDSATIVTETDSRYLSDFVSDVELHAALGAQQKDGPKDSIQSGTEKSSLMVSNVPPATAQEGSGFTIPFQEVTVTFPGTTMKSYRDQHPERNNSVSYQLVSGELAGGSLVVSHGAVDKLSQRYSTIITATLGQQVLELTRLIATTSWTEVKPTGSSYAIAAPGKHVAPQASVSQIQMAIREAAKKGRLPKRSIKDWEMALRKIQSTNHPMLRTNIRTFLWKLEGKDASGKAYTKQIKVDIPSSR